MTTRVTTSKVEAGVSVEHIDGHWAVQVVEDGEVTQQIFETEE